MAEFSDNTYPVTSGLPWDYPITWDSYILWDGTSNYTPFLPVESPVTEWGDQEGV